VNLQHNFLLLVRNYASILKLNYIYNGSHSDILNTIIYLLFKTNCANARAVG